MLNYQIKVNKMSEMTEVEYDSLYLSPDLSYMSGVTSCDYNLINGQTVYLYTNDHDGFQEYPIEVKKVQRRGYVKYAQSFDILTDENGERYITYIDGQSYVISDGKVYIDQTWYDNIDNGATKYPILIKYYVENGYVTIYNTSYEVDFEYEQPYITLRDGTELLVQNYNKVVSGNVIPNISYVTHFTIRKSLDYKVKVNDICCTKNYPYIIYQTDMIDGVSYPINAYLAYGENDSVIATWLNFNKEFSSVTGTAIGIDQVLIDDETYNVYEEWRNVKNASKLHLYLDSSDYYFEGGQVIKTTTKVAKNTSFKVVSGGGNTYVNINGTRYDVYGGLMYVQLADGIERCLYEFQDSGGDTTYYFVENNQTCVGEVDNEKKIFIPHISYSGLSDFEYNVIDYNYIIFNGEICKFSSNENFVVITTPLSVFLIVEHVTSGNMLRCSVEGDEDASDFIQNLVKNPSDYLFELYSPLFDESQVKPMSLYDRKNFSVTYKIYNPQQYVTIPLVVGSEVGLNLQQEDLVQDKFVKKEITNRINPIIDMEKDIYYPVYENAEGKHALVDKIVIDLHFLERDLDTWKIKEDATYNILTAYTSDEIEKNPYYQPSDLLYFLNFTNNDVFYQKTKIKKTFLRLSFYDSMDPMHQSLLHTATVFLNEGMLYAKYTDNMYSDQQYKSIEKMDGVENNIILDAISVKNDTVNENGEINMDENARLSCQFTILNRYESKESSEGFYLYMFKEFSQGLHPSNIYMKVEFNHAGEGKTINFMQPYKVENGEKAMLDLSNDTDIDTLSKGVALSELYEHLYIPFKVVYDDNLKKYVYHLENWLNKHNDDKSILRLNLYEVNFKNES